MSRGLDGPGPNDRAQPAGRRTADGVRVGAADDVDTGQRAVLSALVENEPGVLAKVTSLFARRQINIERLVSEPIDDGAYSRITFVVEPPHPGVMHVKMQLEKVLPVVTVEDLEEDATRHLTADIDRS